MGKFGGAGAVRNEALGGDYCRNSPCGLVYELFGKLVVALQLWAVFIFNFIRGKKQ